jgi:hypothetical protein
VGCDQILFGFFFSSRVSHPLFLALVRACERASEGGKEGAKREGNTDEADFVEGPREASDLSQVQQRWGPAVLLCQGSYSHCVVRAQRRALGYLPWP